MIDINLLDPQSPNHPALCQRVVLGAIPGLLIIASLGLLCWHHQLQRQIEETRPLERQLQEEELALNRIKTQAESSQTEQLRLSKEVASLQGLKRTRCIPIDILETAARSLPLQQTLSLTSLSQEEGKVRFCGSSFNFPAIVDFVRGLEDSTVFSSVKLIGWKSNHGFFDFEILCLLEG